MDGRRIEAAEENGFKNVLIKPARINLFDTVIRLRCEQKKGQSVTPKQAGLSLANDGCVSVFLVEDNKINQIIMGHLEDTELFIDLAENGEAASEGATIIMMSCRWRQMLAADGNEAANHRSDPAPVVTHHSDDRCAIC
jgi:hypothetical protein